MNKGGLADVEPEFYFWLCDGRIIKNALDLANAEMSALVYEYHANSGKNDFADWIRDIVKDEKLAYYVRKAKNKDAMTNVIMNYYGKATLEKKAVKKTAEVPGKKPTEQKPDRPAEKQTQHKAPAYTQAQIRKKDADLTKEEKKLDEWEERLNSQKIELTKKRYECLKKRGELEKQKLEYFLKRKISLPVHDEQPEYSGKEPAEKLLQEARQKLKENPDDATKLLNELKATYARSLMPASEKKHLKYEIMELETELKLVKIRE